MKTQTFAERFWEKVDKTSTPDGCWEWRGEIRNTGYGRVYVPSAKKCQGAHRVAYALQHGPIPDGLFVCHHCDNRRCVRGDHLFAGTAADNVHDARQKKRMRSNVLTHGQRRELYERLKAGENARELALEYGVSYVTVRRRAHVPPRTHSLLSTGETLSDAARRVGLSPSVVKSRIENGMCEADALRLRRRSDLTINGVTRGVGEWLRAIGITREAYRQRLLKGMTREQAATLPKASGCSH